MATVTLNQLGKARKTTIKVVKRHYECQFCEFETESSEDLYIVEAQFLAHLEADHKITL